MTTKVIQSKATEAKNTISNIIRNVTEFVQASSLVVVSAFAGYAVKTGKVTGFVSYVLAIAASIIAVRGAYELLRSFNK